MVLGANMPIPAKELAMAITFLAPFTASAQADDAAYCQALAAEYQRYFVKSSGHSPRSGPIDGNVAAEQCRAGNVAGIPVLEQKLRDAKVTLPPRG
jgi:hypothetical protein